jgi:hypothetical protein
LGFEVEQDVVEDTVPSQNSELTTEYLQELESFSECDSGEVKQDHDIMPISNINEF